jgi:hypothetical protein
VICWTSVPSGFMGVDVGDEPIGIEAAEDDALAVGKEERAAVVSGGPGEAVAPEPSARMM